jgi:cysteine-rich repeat protein
MTFVACSSVCASRAFRCGVSAFLAIAASLYVSSSSAAPAAQGAPASSPVHSKNTLEGGVCGDSVLDAGEQCDDGNDEGGDGCSETCQVEPGFQCTDPVPANTTNLVQDPGFEAGPMGGIWDEFSFNFGTPVCDEMECGVAGQRSGVFWVWFGGIADVVEEGFVAQSLVLPETVTDISFWLSVPSCDSPMDYVELLLDDLQVWTVDGGDAACGDPSYEQITVDISAAADGQVHELEFHSETFSDNDGFTDFFIDDVEVIHGPVVPIPSDCESIGGFIFGSGFESS